MPLSASPPPPPSRPHHCTAPLHHSRRYFHAYRIDHILGFFRIWEIPGNCSSGILGHFRPSIPLSRQVGAAAVVAPTPSYPAIHASAG